MHKLFALFSLNICSLVYLGYDYSISIYAVAYSSTISFISIINWNVIDA